MQESTLVDDAIIKCPSCGQANRVPPLGSGKKAVCGKCKAPLDASAGGGGGGHPTALTDATFRSSIAKGNTVVDFWAAWCGPCRVIGPVIDALAAETPGVRFAKVNVDENPRTAAAFDVRSIPMLVFMRDGVEAGRLVGAVPRQQIVAAMSQYFR